ncbi:MAG: hypothetical protein JRI22_21390 [Deltaproteobacteria bacterium]|nr:hypothetical protein [Deltaproteobacteria bacterium]
MNPTSLLEKLRILLTHWVEHNREHLEEFRRWAAQAEQADQMEVASHLNAAAAGMEGVNGRLLAALDTIGGPLEKQK